MDALWLFLAIAGGGTLAGAAYVVIGGAGVHRALKHRLDAAETEIESVRLMLVREIKRRASDRAAEVRAEALTDKQLKAEAEKRLAQSQGAEDAPVVPGFTGKFVS